MARGSAAARPACSTARQAARQCRAVAAAGCRVCATISTLCDTHPSSAAVESHKLLQLLGTVLSKVLDQGNQRKWRQAAYAARVCCLMQALHMVLCMAGVGSNHVVSNVVAKRVSSQLSHSGSMPKLAVAVQEVAVMLVANKKAVGAAAGPSQQDQHHPAGTQLPATMLLFLVVVLQCWPGGMLGSAPAAPLVPAAQLAHAAISTFSQRWEASSGGQQQQNQLQQRVVVQQELSACVMLSELLMRLLHEADWEKIHQQPHSLQLLQAPQYHQLMLLLLAVRAQQLPEQTAGNSASSVSGLNSSLHAAFIAGNAGTTSSSSSSISGTSSSISGTSSSSSGCGQQTMQQHLASSITAAGQTQQLPHQLQLWQSLGLPQQLLGVACASLGSSEPCEEYCATCSVLNYCLQDLVVAYPGRYVSHDELSPSQMAVVRLHQPVPVLLLETAAAFISNTSLVISCANAAARSVDCRMLVLDEQLARKTGVKGQSGAAAQGASTAAAQLPVRELQQLVLQLFKQLMQQPEAAGKPQQQQQQQQQQAKTASSSSQSIAGQQQQQQPGGSTNVTHALSALMRVLRSLLRLPVGFHLSWQGFSAVLQTFVRNLLSCRSSKDMVITKQGTAVQMAAIDFNQVLDVLCIQHGSQEPGQLVRAAAAAAAGDAEQLQLFGLLLSTIKLWQSHMLVLVGGRGEEVLPSAESMRLIHNLGLAAHHMLAGLAPAAGSSTAGVGAVQPAAVPWLVLQARCLFLAGALLHKQAALKPTGGPDDPGPLGRTNAVYAAEHRVPGIHACVAGAAEVASRLATYLRSCCCPASAADSNSNEPLAWQTGNAGTCTTAASSSSDSRQQADLPAAQAGILTAPSAATTAAAGTVGCELQQELLSLAEALMQGVTLATTTVMGRTFPQLPVENVILLQQLQQGSGRLEELSGQFTALGAALCSQLATPLCCNYPGCTNMAMASEQQLVGGKSCICAGCQVARYCGKECQTAHWKQHRPVCRRIRKAAAVAGGSTL